MATTFVDVSEDDELQELSRSMSVLLGKLEGGAAGAVSADEAATLLKDKKQDELVARLVAQLPRLLAAPREAVSDRDLEAVFNVLHHAVQLRPATASGNSAALVTALTGQRAAARTGVVLKILNTVYNTQVAETSGAARCELFLQLLEYAQQTGQAVQLLGELEQAPALLAEWKATPEQARRLYRGAVAVLTAAGRRDDAFGSRIKLLETFEGATPAELATAVANKGEAVQFAVEALRAPRVYQYDYLLELAAIKALAADAATAPLAELLKLFAHDRLAAFNAFEQKHSADFWKSYPELKADDCRLKIRLLTLASLAATSSELSYKDIATSLEVDEADVEQWVVLAISSNILDARIDQIQRSVTVTRSIQRVFTQAQWQLLAGRLAAWRDGVRRLQGTLRDAAAKIEAAKIEGANAGAANAARA